MPGSADSKDVDAQMREKRQSGAMTTEFVPKPPGLFEAVEKTEDLAQLDATHTMTQKMLANPLIPAGALATVGALTLGVRAMLRGDRKTQQVMMRYRIGFQGLTILAILGGTLYATLSSVYGKDHVADKHTKPK